MQKSKSILALLLCCACIVPAFSAAEIFDKTADWTLETSKIKTPGSVTATGAGDTAVYTVKGNGDDIWNKADEGFYAYKAIAGSFSIQAKVKWVNPGDNYGANAANYEWAKVGVMIRSMADNADSSHFSLVQRAGSAVPSDILSIQTRAAAGIDSNNVDQSITLPDGAWLRVSRWAPLNYFWAEYSEDGETWNYIGATAIAMADAVNVGLCITNHYDDATLAEATVSDVKITTLTAEPSSHIKKAIGIFDGSVDLGDSKTSGTSAYDAASKTYTVSGAGSDIWGTRDDGHYMFKKMKGAFEAESEFFITVPVEATWTKAGMMIRDSLSMSAANAFAYIRTDNQFQLNGRPSLQASTTDSPLTTITENKFKIVKNGTQVTSYIWDGAASAWVFRASKPFPLVDESYFGFMVLSHTNPDLAAATMSNLKITELPLEISQTASNETVTQGQSTDIRVTLTVREGVTSNFSVTELYSATAAITNLKASAGTATDDKKGTITWTGTGVTGSITLNFTMNIAENADVNEQYSVAGAYDDGKGVSGSFNTIAIGIKGAEPLDLGIFAGFTEIGTGNKGKVTHQGDDWAVIGSGADIWGTADTLEYLYLQVNGNFTLSVTNAKIGGWGVAPSSDDWQKMGIMARQSLDANSAHATALIRKSDQGYMLQWRPSAGADSLSGDGTALTTAADHSGNLMLKREGNIFSTYYIDAAGEEIYQNEIDIEMTDPIYLGIAATAHSEGLFSAGTFSKPVFKGTAVPVTPPGVDAWMMF